MLHQNYEKLDLEIGYSLLLCPMLWGPKGLAFPMESFSALLSHFYPPANPMSAEQICWPLPLLTTWPCIWLYFSHHLRLLSKPNRLCNWNNKCLFLKAWKEVGESRVKEPPGPESGECPFSLLLLCRWPSSHRSSRGMEVGIELLHVLPTRTWISSVEHRPMIQSPPKSCLLLPLPHWWDSGTPVCGEHEHWSTAGQSKPLALHIWHCHWFTSASPLLNCEWSENSYYVLLIFIFSDPNVCWNTKLCQFELYNNTEFLAFCMHRRGPFLHQEGSASNKAYTRNPFLAPLNIWPWLTFRELPLQTRIWIVFYRWWRTTLRDPVSGSCPFNFPELFLIFFIYAYAFVSVWVGVNHTCAGVPRSQNLYGTP